MSEQLRRLLCYDVTDGLWRLFVSAYNRVVPVRYSLRGLLVLTTAISLGLGIAPVVSEIVRLHREFPRRQAAIERLRRQLEWLEREEAAENRGRSKGNVGFMRRP